MTTLLLIWAGGTCGFVLGLLFSARRAGDPLPGEDELNEDRA